MIVLLILGMAMCAASCLAVIGWAVLDAAAGRDVRFPAWDDDIVRVLSADLMARSARYAGPQDSPIRAVLTSG